MKMFRQITLLTHFILHDSDGKYVASCAVHSMPVEAFIEPAEQKDTRVRGCIVSIAKDNSIALISVDSMTW